MQQGARDDNERYGVTLEEVADAVRELLEEGVEPTVRAVRGKIGRGSLSTIGPMVKLVKEGHGVPAKQLERFGPRLIELITEMTGHMKVMAADEVAGERTKLAELTLAVENKMSALQLEHDNAVNQLSHTSLALADLTDRLDKTEQAAAATRAELQKQIEQEAIARTEAAKWQERALRSEADTTQARSQRDHFEQQATEQRKHDAERHREQMDAIQASYNKLQERLSTSTTLCASLGGEKELISTQLGYAKTELDKATAKIESQQKIIADLSTDKIADDMTIQRLSSEQNELLRQLHSKSDQVSAAQAELIEVKAATTAKVDEQAQQQRSIVINLVEHSRRAMDAAIAKSKKGDHDLAELVTAQREIEKYFK